MKVIEYGSSLVTIADIPFPVILEKVLVYLPLDILDYKISKNN